MKSVRLPSKSNPSLEAPQWLQEKVYLPKIERTVSLVKASVDALVEANQPVSKATVVEKSKELDPDGRGVSPSAIKRNPDAYAYYEQHRSYKPPASNAAIVRSSKRSPVANASPEPKVGWIKPGRDLQRVRQRYLRLSKAELVEQLLQVEQGLVEQQELWHHSNDNLLAHYLRVEEEQDFQPDSLGEEREDLITKHQRLRSSNRELSAQLAGMDSLEKENEALRKQNQRLFNRVTQLEAPERQMNNKRFVEALREAKQQSPV